MRYTDLRDRLTASPKTWLVTGAAGFIGSNLVEELLRLGQTVIGLDNLSTGYERNLNDAAQRAGGADRLDFIEGDLRDVEGCRDVCEGADYVLHQGALGSVPRSIEDPRATHEANSSGTLNMLLAARDAEVEGFVYASSSSVYGDHPGLPKVEEEVGTPLSPYAVTKRTGEFYAKTFFEHYQLRTVGLRYFNVFGRRQDPSGAYAAVIPKWIGALLRGGTCYINGDGETSRDFCYISNVVQANILAAVADEEAAGAVFNIAFGERTTLNELFVYLCDGLAEYDPALEDAEPEYRDFRAGDVRHSLADTSKAARLLGYAPTHSAEEGLQEAISWYAEQGMSLLSQRLAEEEASPRG
jgi:UDP-N-acetylglucosamine 4-epimerase